MFKKRVKRGAERDDSQIQAGGSGDVQAAARKPKLARNEEKKFAIEPEHYSTMIATTAVDQNVAVLAPAVGQHDDGQGGARAGPGLYTGTVKEKNPFGPMKAPANIRVVTRIDYQPDICKDYKETGYCGYGDSCKFLHDRGDYKAGWQIDQEWEQEQRLKAKNGAVPEENFEIDSDEDAFPFACHLCRKPFVDPVVTRCQHYFCQQCALRRHTKSTKCAVCSKQTLGIFNTATQLIKKIRERELEEGGAGE